MIRQAKGKDVAAIMVLLEECHEESAFTEWFDPEYSEELLRHYMQDEGSRVFVGGDPAHGVLVLTKSPLHFNSSCVAGVEVAFWAKKDGRSLVDAAKQWMIEEDLSRLRFSNEIHARSSSLDRWYMTNGFSRFAIEYVYTGDV